MDNFDFEELIADMFGITDDQREDDDFIPSKLYEEFDIDFDNAFKAQWELFLKHVVLDTPFPWDLMEGAKGVQLAELGIESWEKKTWITIPDLK